MQGNGSPALERYREERAAIARLDRLEREGQLLPRDEVREALGRIAAILRGAGDTLQRQYGQAAADILLERGVGTAIIKMGAAGAVYASSQPEARGAIPAFTVKAVDTVAAGDAFNGGLATALLEDHPLAEAIRWGAAAGALSATKAGAQPSMPTRTEFDNFITGGN